ncbi:benzoate/H(+) symporter BenE family transporter [Pseudoalteromonas sp. OOF1S-7]|uniref:benzoate/H(+) symporter BenE family transporter n=1 Tax=Pseudoalteromonas sp. OOF1S-7 TaxID=2917757 RepID=UPI001EF6892E|nr:benzoate/H(+) symporter BenE family transporter [Pseudoalteromonas sp. OOF1S-7]MCG7533908.1 benzoate/H(+) symporter BenE family transporter [Pseudoalteromonas sp. OOF1S-7]
MPGQLQQLKTDYANSALVAGLIAVIVSYAGPLIIVFQAAQAAGLSPEQVSSWVWAISIGSALSGIYLSWRLKIPIITAWSTPGAALLVASLGQYSFEQAIGAYLVSAGLIFIFGLTGWFQTMMDKIPKSIASAMLAGILFNFGVSVFTSIPLSPELVLPVLLAYLITKRVLPRYAIVSALFSGVALAFLFGQIGQAEVDFAFATPVFTYPEFSLSAIIGLAIPLFIVTMTSQNVPGVAVLKSAGYQPAVNTVISGTGLVSVLLAPFGAHGINLAAITAAICTGEESHKDASKRYIAGLSCGAFYLIIGLFGATIASAFSILPAALVATVAGLALFGALSNGLHGAMAIDKEREAALITFLVTVSGLSIYGVGAAFWGLIAGMVTCWLLNSNLVPTIKKPKKQTEQLAEQSAKVQ